MVEITTEEFQKLSDYIRNNYGISMGKEKKPLMASKLHSILEEKGIKSFTEYFQYVVSDRTGEAGISLVNRISTNYSYFMRETKHFYYLRNVLLPYFEKSIQDHDFRIWSAGCATGEEAYTLAFILEDYFKGKGMWDKKLLATDISARALKIASEGVYSSDHVSAVPEAWKRNYFKKIGEDFYMVSDRIKKDVLFRHYNLVKENFQFQKPFHVIFFRNVMIYFDEETRSKTMDHLYDVTAPGGYLFLGHSESLARWNAKYQYVMPSVYKKV